MFLGAVVFLVGVGLIAATFWRAYDIFDKTPQINLGIEAGKPIDFNIVGLNFVRQIVKVLLLVVMALIGSLLATKGVKMYSSAPHVKGVPEEARPPSTTRDV